MIKRSFVTMLALLIVACAAAGVPATNDPKQKRNDAEALLKDGRPLPAERLIREAMTQYKERNDYYELGLTQVMYGMFIRSRSFEAPFFRKQYPGTDSPEQRDAMARGFFQEGINNYHKAIADPSLSDDIRTGYYWRAFLVYEVMGDSQGVCASLLSMSTSNKAYTAQHPNGKVYVQPPHKTFDEYISYELNRAHCSIQ